MDTTCDITGSEQKEEDDVSEEDKIINLRKNKQRCNSVIDSEFKNDLVAVLPGHTTPQRPDRKHLQDVSPDQGFSETPGPLHSSKEDNEKHIDATDAITTNEEDEYGGYSPNPEIFAKMPVEMDSDRYNMNHENRGKCVVFNHDKSDIGATDREGSIVDVKKIQKTFTNLGFVVEVHHNLTYDEILIKISELSDEDHTDNDCLCVFMLTHGRKDDKIYARDSVYNAERIWKSFTADKCTTLAGKPKLFFYQVCRGDQLDGGVSLLRSKERTETDGGTPSTASYKIPTHADFLIAHSTTHGFSSWRNPVEGTWFVQSLCEVIDEHAATKDLFDMLLLTSRKVAIDYSSHNDIDPRRHGQKQVPSITSTLIRKVYFKCNFENNKCSKNLSHIQ